MIEKIVKTEIPGCINAISNLRCNRCFGNNLDRDYLGISYCLDCYELNEINSQMFLLREERLSQTTKHQLKLDFSLSLDQERAKEFILKNMQRDKSVFLQAVCGAGKTEIVLELIKNYLDNNLKTAFVIPRVEIIKQVFDRLKNYFPKTKILQLHGNQSIIDNSLLVILTPQQLIKFYAEFDLMILDEVDAFPFADNPFLERLVDKAKKKSCFSVYMSATISSNYLSKIKNKELMPFFLPKRFHYRKLAIPEILKITNYKDKSLINLIDNLTIEHQLIIYVASINKGDVLTEYLTSRNYNCSLITSKTKFKESIIRSFSRKEINILVSTTILERGVTFKSISVIVIEADNRVFSKSTLIQIAGRVGRLDDSGKVFFLAKHISKEMLKAKQDIVTMNNSDYEM